MTPDYLDAGPDEAADSPPVVLLHGLGGSKHYWGPLVDRLATTRRTIAWTMPGYDGTAPLDDMTFAGLADAVVALLDHTGVDRAVVVGHSMGGMVAQQLWADAPARVAGLVLVGTSPSFGGGDQTFIDAFLETRLAPILDGRTPADFAAAVIDEMCAGTPPPIDRQRAIDSMSSIDAHAYEQAVRCLTTFDRRDTLPTISEPTLMISGDQDRLGPTRLMAAMAAQVDGAHHVDIANSGHLIDLEQPEAFATVLEDFLQEHWPV